MTKDNAAWLGVEISADEPYVCANCYKKKRKLVAQQLSDAEVSRGQEVTVG